MTWPLALLLVLTTTTCKSKQMACHSVEVASVKRSGIVDVYAVMPTMPPINGMPTMPQFLPPTPIPDEVDQKLPSRSSRYKMVPKTAEQFHTLQHVARIQYTDTVRSWSEANATKKSSTNKPACTETTRFKLLIFIGLIALLIGSLIIGLFVVRVFRPRG